jgi:hypothetical protein
MTLGALEMRIGPILIAAAFTVLLSNPTSAQPASDSLPAEASPSVAGLPASDQPPPVQYLPVAKEPADTPLPAPKKAKASVPASQQPGGGQINPVRDAAENDAAKLRLAKIVGGAALVFLVLFVVVGSIVKTLKISAERYGHDMLFNRMSLMWIVMAASLAVGAMFGMTGLLGGAVFAVCCWLTLLIYNIRKTSLPIGLLGTLVQPFALVLSVVTVVWLFNASRRVMSTDGRY